MSDLNTAGRVVPRSFADVIGDIRAGGLANELAEHMQTVAQAVDMHGKPGELTLKIKLKPVANGVEVTDSIATKVPDYDRPGSFFFVHSSGLQRNPVNQDRLPGVDG
jgi:hypothetical protein